jgi:hypothetical protein
MSERLKFNITAAALFAALCCLWLPLCAAAGEATPPEDPPAAEAPVPAGFFVTCVSGCSSYLEGDLFSPEGYSGSLVYSDGSVSPLAADQLVCLTTAPLVPDAGTGSATAQFLCTVTGTTSGVPVTVVPVSSLKVGGTYKTVYRSCEDKFSTEGMEISLVYANGTEKQVPVADCVFSCDAEVPMTPDITSVTVSYTLGSHTVSTSVSVKVRRVSTLYATFTSSTKYYEGQLFSCTSEELSVRALYEGETESSPVFNYDVSDQPLTPGSDGTSPVTISLDGRSTVIRVDTVPLQSIVAERVGHLDLYAGDVFTTEGITLKAMYGDEFRIDITDEAEFTYPAAITSGSTVTASWQGRPVDLSGILTVHSGTLAVLKAPTKTAYSVGESFDPAGMIMVLTYDNGRTVKLDIAQCQVTAPDPLSATDSKAYVSWYGYSAECEFMVFSDRRVDRIEISAPPTLIRYVEGQRIDISGIRVLVYYTDVAEPEEVPFEMLSTVPALDSPVTKGMTSFTVRYSLSPTVHYDATQFIEVVAKEPTALAVTTPPATVDYNEGENFSSEGMVVCLVYNDGSLVPVTGYTVSQTSPFFLDSDEDDSAYRITVSYKNFDADCKVSVKARKVKSISILSTPTTTVYRTGQSFDPTGLKLVLNYRDANVSPVLLHEGEYTITPSGPLDESVTKVYFSCRGHTVGVDVEVNLSGTHVETTAPAQTSAPITQPPDTDSGSDTEQGPDTGTEPPEESTPGTPEVSTADQSPVTGQTPETTGGSSDNGPDSVLILWIVVISVIAVGIVVLIIYYKRHFT